MKQAADFLLNFLSSMVLLISVLVLFDGGQKCRVFRSPFLFHTSGQIFQFLGVMMYFASRLISALCVAQLHRKAPSTVVFVVFVVLEAHLSQTFEAPPFFFSLKPTYLSPAIHGRSPCRMSCRSCRIPETSGSFLHHRVAMFRVSRRARSAR